MNHSLAVQIFHSNIKELADAAVEKKAAARKGGRSMVAGEFQPELLLDLFGGGQSTQGRTWMFTDA